MPTKVSSRIYALILITRLDIERHLYFRVVILKLLACYSTHMEMIFCENNFVVKELSSAEEHETAFRLRYEVFCEELRWVPASLSRLDVDAYDEFAHSLGIFNEKNELLGHVRLIHSPKPFMIEKEFSTLLPNDKPFKKPLTMFEATRICVKKSVRTDKHLTMSIVYLLYKAMYHWSKMNALRYLLTIVEKRYYVLLKRSKFPFEQIGDFKLLGEGVLSGIVVMDWEKFDVMLNEKRPDFYNWFIELPEPDHRRLRSHGLY